MQSLSVAPAVGLGLAAENGSLRRQRTRHGFPHLRYAHSRNASIRAGAPATKRQAEALEYRKLGDSDLVISEITLGTVSTLEQLRSTAGFTEDCQICRNFCFNRNTENQCA